MIQTQFARAPGTRTARVEPRQRRLESLSAELALLAQRRARVAHQLDLLEQQRLAASLTFAKLQARMSWLARRMDAVEPDLRGLEVDQSTPALPPLPSAYPPALPGLLARKAAPSPTPAATVPPAKQPPGRQRLAIRPALSPHKARNWRV